MPDAVYIILGCAVAIGLFVALTIRRNRAPRQLTARQKRYLQNLARNQGFDVQLRNADDCVELTQEIDIYLN